MSLAVALAVIDDEFPALAERGSRAGWTCALDRDQLVVDIRLRNRLDHEFHLQGNLKEYKALPPCWTFISPNGQAGTFDAFPEPPNPTPGGKNAIFINHNRQAYICLPCNRLCFGAVHGEWQTASWMDIEPKYITLAEMVNRIYVDLEASPGPWRLP